MNRLLINRRLSSAIVIVCRDELIATRIGKLAEASKNKRTRGVLYVSRLFRVEIFPMDGAR